MYTPNVGTNVWNYTPDIYILGIWKKLTFYLNEINEWGISKKNRIRIEFGQSIECSVDVVAHINKLFNICSHRVRMQLRILIDPYFHINHYIQLGSGIYFYTW